MDILAEYCGYLDWQVFIDVAASDSKSLSCNEEAKIYLDFFKIKVVQETDINYHNACENIAKRIFLNQHLLQHLASSLAKNETAQIFFFERFPFIDGLNDNYLTAIRLYLNNKRTTESQIFGNSLLFLSAYLRNEPEKLKKYYEKLCNFEISNTVHPFVIARHIGSRILYKKNMCKSYDTEIDEVFKLAKRFSKPDRILYWQFPHYQFMIADYFNLCDETELASDLLKNYYTSATRNYIVSNGYMEALEIVQQIANYKSDPGAFIQWYKSFDKWNEVSFQFRNYFRLQSLTILLKIMKPSSKQYARIKSELHKLIEATAYTYFVK